MPVIAWLTLRLQQQPETSSLDFFIEHGFNTFRIPFAMERMSPPATGLGSPFDSAYLGDLKTTVNYITGKGGYAVIDPHNYMRYNGAVITDATAYVSYLFFSLDGVITNNPTVSSHGGRS